LSEYLVPNVLGSPGTSGVKVRESEQAADPKVIPKELKSNDAATPFDQLLSREFSQLQNGDSLKEVKPGLKFSQHAQGRITSRKLDVGTEAMRKLNEAVDKAAAKGIQDTLVLMDQSAFIVNVKNRTVVTAIDRGSLDANVFTNIDGAVIV
jgi:flagellar operon protein